MVIMSGTATVLQQFVSGLKSRNEDTRAKSAKDLQHYVTTELREVTAGRNIRVIEICREDILSLRCILSVVVQSSAVYTVSVADKKPHSGVADFFSENIDVLFCFFYLVSI